MMPSRERVDLLAIQQLCLSDLQRDNTKVIVDAMINDRNILQRALQSQSNDTRKLSIERVQSSQKSRHMHTRQ